MAPEVVSKVKDIVIRYGLPIAGFAAGYFGGDMMGIKAFVSGLIPAEMNLSPKVIGVVLAAVMLGLAVFLWGLWDGVGPFIGGILAGMGVNLLVGALKGA